MKLTELLQQVASTKQELQTQLSWTQAYTASVVRRDQAPVQSARRPKQAARREVAKIRRLILKRMQLRQQLARTLAAHPDVVALLAERQVARLRVRILLELQDRLATRMPMDGRSAEVSLLPGSWRQGRQQRRAYSQEHGVRMAFERFFDPALPPVPRPPGTAWPNLIRQGFEPALDVDVLSERLKAARKGLAGLER